MRAENGGGEGGGHSLTLVLRHETTLKTSCTNLTNGTYPHIDRAFKCANLQLHQGRFAEVIALAHKDRFFFTFTTAGRAFGGEGWSGVGGGGVRGGWGVGGGG